ncbi:glycoside hydrolase family 19 protein [Bizionia hallyeonensis]|uniref:Glycoside hydrolase family 19 protein n=1 Tax=Bizionia hallyeonensis TaxID=1123757 RepID=A0ABW0C5Q3_9FLAO
MQSKATSINGREVYSEENGFTINTDYCKEIFDGIKYSYIFPVYREEDNGFLENLWLIEEVDSTYTAYLVQYEFTAEDITAHNFRQQINVENKITYIELNADELVGDIFGKYYYNGACYEDLWTYQEGTRCQSTKHTFAQGNECDYWGTTDMATNGGYVLLPTLVPCGDGGGGPSNGGNPPDYNPTNPNSNPNHGGGTQSGSTTPVTCKFCPELEPPIDSNDEGEEDDCNTSKDELKKIFPNISDTNAELLASIINDKGKDFGINSDEDLWHFLSQAGHETGGFNTLNVTESTYWTTASKLAGTYSWFTMDSLQASLNENIYFAPDYLQNSSGVANVAMCCKYGNRDVASGDGYKYRGRGIFQLTWKDNYTAFKTWYNNNYNPDIDPVTEPEIIASNDTLAVLSGLWYYKTRVINEINIDSSTTVDNVTVKINGKSKKGLTDRKERFQKAKDSINCL